MVEDKYIMRRCGKELQRLRHVSTGTGRSGPRSCRSQRDMDRRQRAARARTGMRASRDGLYRVSKSSVSFQSRACHAVSLAGWVGVSRLVFLTV